MVGVAVSPDSVTIYPVVRFYWDDLLRNLRWMQKKGKKMIWGILLFLAVPLVTAVFVMVEEMSWRSVVMSVVIISALQIIGGVAIKLMNF
jgi:hypothetical protein